MYDFDAKYGSVLHAFASYAPGKNCNLKVQQTRQGIYKVTSYGKIHSLIVHLFSRYFRPVDDLKPLKKMFGDILLEVQTDEALKQTYGALVHDAMQGMKRYFEQYRNDTSVEAMVKRNDILEGLSLAFIENGFNKTVFDSVFGAPPLLRADMSIHSTADTPALLPLVGRIERIAASPIAAAKKVKEHSVLYVCYQDLEKALDAFNKSDTVPSEKELQSVLGNLLKDEEVPHGKAIDFLYKHHFDSHALNLLITHVAKFRFGTKMIADFEKIVRYFKALNIEIESALDGKLYSYSEIFTDDLRDPKSYSSAFTRDVNSMARKRYLQKALDVQEEIKRITGGACPVVISNSFNRMRLHLLREGQAEKTLEITGKLLTDAPEAVEVVMQEGDKTAGSAVKFPFTVKEMLGVQRSMPLVPDDIVHKQNLNEKSASHAMLKAMTSLVDKERMLLVIQRLAPQDIHHFYASTKSRILDRKECCEKLKTALAEKVGTDADPKEILQLEELIAYFAGNARIAEKATVNITGTLSTISPKGLFHRPEILAQNDRKIMMVEHDDGSLAIHVFIGAAGVDQIDVSAKVQKNAEELGFDYGSMSWGRQKQREGWLGKRFMKSEEKKKAADSIQIHQKAEKQRKFSTLLGTEVGSFAVGGSTVVSLYFRKDFIPEEKIDAFFQKAYFQRVQRGVVRTVLQKKAAAVPDRALELRMELGNVIALPIGYAAFTIMQNIVGTKVASKEEFIAHFLERAGAMSFTKNTQSQVLCKELIALYQSVDSQRSSYQKQLFKKLEVIFAHAFVSNEQELEK